MIKSFIRDSAYFQSMRDKEIIINAEDFDIQFNNLVDYINLTVKPIADNVAVGIAGTNAPGTANYLLRNVGDGTTEFAPLNNAAINNYSVNYVKLARAAIGSIIAADNNRIFRQVTPTDNNQAFVSQINNLPVFKKLIGNNFANKTIQGPKINYAAITRESLSPSVIGRPLPDNAVINSYIADQAISGSKLADGSLPLSKFNAAMQAAINQTAASGNYLGPFGSPSVYNQYDAGGPIPYTPENLQIYGYQNRHFAANSIPALTINNRLSLTAIADNSITLADFGPNRAAGVGFADGAITPNKIIAGSVDFRNTQSNVTISRTKLSPAIRAKLGI
jgi:hypothetical protein